MRKSVRSNLIKVNDLATESIFKNSVMILFSVAFYAKNAEHSGI